MNRKHLGTFLKIAYCTGIAAMTVLLSIRDARANLKKDAVIEAGSSIRIEDFFSKLPQDAGFVTDISSIDTTVPAVYKLKVHHDLVFTDTVSLRIEDTTAPTGDGLTKKILSYEELPDASEMVSNAFDLSGIASVEYAVRPDITEGGDIYAPIRLTDCYGNSSVIPAKLVVIKDSSSPEIHGITDISIVQGQTPDLSSGVYATDDISSNISVRIDASKLKTDVPGKYEIIYKASDDAGNTTTKTSTVTVTAKPEPEKKAKKKAPAKKKSADYSRADKLAEALVKKLKKGSATETARAIFKWVHKNIHYVNSGSKLTGKKAAYQGLTKHSGNCRVYAYTCRLLLNKAGIRNMIVTRYPVTTHHYWNLVYLDGGWYHCDATPFRDHKGIYFKLTDAQLDKHHKFKKSKYPARATS